MADKLLIGISLQGAAVADWRGNRIRDCRVYAGDEAGLAAYRFDMLPHASGRDRAELVARKLRQHYRNSPYAAAWLLGRDAGKRRDDRYLFSALTNPELLAEWLQPVIARRLPVAGIYLLPMVSAGLLQKLEHKAPNLLLVAQHATGLRLTFFRDGNFRLSRLTRGDSGRAETRARFYSEEISNTRLYLHALRTLTLDEPLMVVLVDRGEEMGDVAAAVSRDNPTIECVRLGRQELAERFDVSESLLETSSYALYLHLLGLREPPSNLAPAGITQEYRRYQARRALYAGCGALAISAAVWSGINLYDALTVRWQSEDAARQTAMLTTQYQEITRQFPQAPASAENLRRMVEIAQKLRASTHNPGRLMALVSRSMEAYPTIVIRELGWKYGTTDIEPQGGARAVAIERAVETPPAPAAPGAVAARRESALIEGEIRPFRGDYRSAIATINSFAERLAAEREVLEVRIAKLPLNVNPSLALSGSTLDNPEQSASATAGFSLVVVMRPDA